MMLGCWVPGAPKLGSWRLGYWRLGGYQACRPRLGGLAGVIAGWLVSVLGCVLTRSTLREVGGYMYVYMCVCVYIYIDRYRYRYRYVCMYIYICMCVYI